MTGAKIFAVAVKQAQNDAELCSEERNEAAKNYSQAALDLIRHILESDPHSASALRDCEEFEPLRILPQFAALFAQ